MRLLLGIHYGNSRRFEFEVRLITLGGESDALEKIAELGLDEKEKLPKAQQMLVDWAFLSELLDIIVIAQDKLTPQFLLDNLATDDYVLITQAIADLRKKHIDAGESQSKVEAE